MAASCRCAAILVVLGVVGILYAPVLRLELTGDDYNWLHLQHRATAEPRLFLADLDGFWRPSSTWTLHLEELVAPHRAATHHAANLAFHLGVVALLGLAARRLLLGDVAAMGVALLWGTSPFAAEPVASVSSRHETLLFCAWLVMILVWPRVQEGWGRWRRVAAGVAVLLAATSKETWVVTPGLVLVLEVMVRRSPPRQVARATGASLVVVLLYAGLHALLLGGSRDYFDISLSTLAKLPHQLAAFFALETLAPLAFPVSFRGALALAATAAAITAAIRLRLPGAMVGAALLFLPSLPTLFVPYLPTRYTAIPYAGFLLLCCGLASWVWHHLDRQRRRLAAIPATGLAALVAVSSAYTLRADLEDYRRLSQLHARLLAEAVQIAPQLPVGIPIAFVRIERENLLRDLALSPRGLTKIYYPRHNDPYALIDTAALFDWTLRPAGLTVQRVGDLPPGAHPGMVLAHQRGGFAWLDRATSDVREAARAWQARAPTQAFIVSRH